MEEKVLVLRCCNSNLTSYNDFKWPSAGPVECPDWDPIPECGNGLHGWLWGAGSSSASSIEMNDPKTLWLVVEVWKAWIVDLGGKVKFPRGNVVYCGDRNTAVKMIADKAPQGTAVMFQTLISTDGSPLSVGDFSEILSYYKQLTISAGDYVDIVAKSPFSKIRAGRSANIIVTTDSRIDVDDYSRITSGGLLTVKGGHSLKVTSGDLTVASVGDYSVLSVGRLSTVTCGSNSRVFADIGSVVRCGENSNLVIRWICERSGKTGLLSAFVASTSDSLQLKPDVFYTAKVIDGTPQFVLSVKN